MRRVPFTKAHGAKNDFLLTWRKEAPERDHAAIARAICERHTGIGADGWILLAAPVDAGPDAEGSMELYNSDGSTAEISGNGTRCAAAFLIRELLLNDAASELIRIRTGAGIKTLRLLKRAGLAFEFEMNMGSPEVTAARLALPLSSGPRDVTLVWVGNPQCAVPVPDFDFDWRAMGAEIESHSQFPNRTNVSFIRSIDAHTIDVRFYERGAGETMSSGTGSTGAAVAAITRGFAKSPLRVLTPAGTMDLRWEEDVYLRGPAEITGIGEFYM